MNILLWVLQGLLAFHTLTGAIWKFGNSEQMIPALQVLPHGFWLGLGVVELLASVGLILPVFKRLGVLAPVSAAFITTEMLFFTGLSVFIGPLEIGSIIYWLVVALLSAAIIFGRLGHKPTGKA
ncbi:MAG: DoxX family protein [candidate division FCPU426 bacterium]